MRFMVAPVAVLVATAAGLVFGVDAVVAVLLLMAAVVVASLLGRLSGVVASVLGAFSLNLFLTDPALIPSISDADDIVALVVFTLVALVVGTLVARADDNRRRAEQREREARLRFDLTSRLLSGESLQDVTQAAAEAIVGLFELASCTLRTGDVVATATGKGTSGREYVLEADQASLSVVAGSATPLSDADLDGLSDLSAGLGTAFGRVQLERLASAARLDSEVNRTRAAFFAAAGHNLRTPLASVAASSAALMDAGDRLSDDERTELLQTIRDETDRLTRMVTKVLTASRIRSGAIEPEREPVDLQGMAQVAVRRLGPLATPDRFELDIPADLGPLQLDPFMLEQILLNTFENAARYAPDDTPVTVSARRLGNRMELRIADRGPGIAPEEREAVFEEFYRGGRRAESEGTGLGLAIVRSLVSAQDGRIEVEETPRGGATIVITFPVSEEEPAAPGGPTLPAQVPAGEAGS